MKIASLKNILYFSILAGTSPIAFAEDLFSLTIDVNGATGKAAFSSVDDLFKKFGNNEFQSIQSNYTNTSAAIATINYRNLPILVTTEAGKQDIRLRIDSIGLDKTFSGSDRDGNLTALTDYFKKDGDNLISQFQKKLVAISPVDPIAGNPNSLQSLMVSNNFDQSFTQFATSIKTGTAIAQSASVHASNGGMTALGLRFGQYSQQGLTSKSITLPLGYVYRSFDSGGQLSINMPLTYGTVSSSSGTAQTVQGSLGMAYRQPINPQWALTPAVNVALSGSVDLGSVAAMRSFSLTSQYSFTHQGYDISIGNMISLYNTLKIQTKDFSYDPGIKNTIFRNGIMVSRPVALWDYRDLSVEVSLINTRFTGTELYNKWTNELGITLGTSKSSDLPNYLRAGLTLLKGEKSQGASINLGYWF